MLCSRAASSPEGRSEAFGVSGRGLGVAAGPRRGGGRQTSRPRLQQAVPDGAGMRPGGLRVHGRVIRSTGVDAHVRRQAGGHRGQGVQVVQPAGPAGAVQRLADPPDGLDRSTASGGAAVYSPAGARTSARGLADAVGPIAASAASPALRDSSAAVLIDSPISGSVGSVCGQCPQRPGEGGGPPEGGGRRPSAGVGNSAAGGRTSLPTRPAPGAVARSSRPPSRWCPNRSPTPWCTAEETSAWSCSSAPMGWSAARAPGSASCSPLIAGRRPSR